MPTVELEAISFPIGSVVDDADKITALLKSAFGPLQRPITHFHCLVEPFGRRFFQRDVLESCPFVNPIASWEALAKELVRTYREERLDKKTPHHEGQVVGWDINRLQMDDTPDIAISVHPAVISVPV